MINTKDLNKVPFFYILSMGRSGSTLLEFLLDAHPNVNIPLESRFIIHLYYKYSNKKKWSSNDKKKFLIDLFKDKKLSSYWKIDKKKLERDILSTGSTVSFFELCRIITASYDSLYPKKEIKIQGNKNPIYGLWSDILYQLYAQSKFIHLVRNPMGVVASQKKLNHNEPLYYAYRWNLINSKIELLKQKKPNNFITVKYEDLINNPEKSLNEICSFLGITFLPSQLKFYERIENYYSKLKLENNEEKLSIFNSHLKNLVNPIDKNAGQSWENSLTEQEKNDICFITKPYLKKYNYNITQEKAKYHLKFIFPFIKVKYRYLRHRLYYRLSFSI